MPPATSSLQPNRRIDAPRPAPAPDAGQSPGEEWLGARLQERLVWAFMALALTARLVRFLLRFPLWEDECFLASNFIDCGFGDLLQPLNYHQVAPLAFLWIELAAVKLLGFNEWSLRLFPFACGVGSLFLFRHLAGRLLQGSARVLAIAAFCASYSGIRYAAEAKPYGPDQLVSLLLLAAAVEWRRGGAGWLAALIGFTPLALGLSYPAVFVAGGVSLFMALVLVNERRRGWWGWWAFNAVLTTSFLIVLRFAAKSQSDSELAWMQDYWKEHLPSLASSWQFVIWFFKTHTGNLLAIPAGGEHGGSLVTFLLVVVGIVVLVRGKRYRLAALCLAPAVLNLAAAMMGRFPYGGHVKFAQYLAPAICILLAVGGAALLSRGRGVDRFRSRKLGLGLAVLALIPLGTMVRDFARPCKSPTDARYRDFARWFWPSLQFAGEAACLHTDLGREFAPGTFHHLGWSAMYLCNQRIYSPRHRRGDPVDWPRISRRWPLHVVEYRAQAYSYDHAACEAWLDSMRERYRLVSRDTFPSPVFDQRGHHLLCADNLVIYKFVPRIPPDG